MIKKNHKIFSTSMVFIKCDKTFSKKVGLLKVVLKYTPFFILINNIELGYEGLLLDILNKLKSLK